MAFVKKLLAIVSAGLCLTVAAAGRFEVSFDRTNAVYRCGEEAVVTVRAVEKDGSAPTGGIFVVSVTDTGTNRVYGKTVKVPQENPLTFRATLKHPGFLRVRATRGAYAASADSAAFEPEKICPGFARPDDFDAFWDGAVSQLEKTVPIDAKKTLVPSLCTADVDFYRVSFATAGGRRVYGSMTVPKDRAKGPFRTVVEVPGAGPYCTASGFPTIHKSRYRKNSIHFLMNVHTYEPCEEKDAQLKAYAEQDRVWGGKYGVKRYCQAGISESREAYFYYASILGINRAVDWLANEPEVDRERLCYSGVSQGGGFGLVLMGLNRNIRRGVAYVPALTDHGGHHLGRVAGWPELVKSQLPENRAVAERYAPYFDACHFASRITCPVRVAVGFADVTCPPTAVYAAYNAIGAKDKAIVHGVGMSHDVFSRPDVYVTLQKWLMETGVDIHTFGASEKSTPSANAAAIQRAIDAVSAVGGGQVVVPAGIWNCGTIWLKRGIDLHLEKGAVLKASGDLADYNREDAYPENWGCPKTEYWRGLHFILCRCQDNVSITGAGVIDGNGDAFFDEKPIAYFGWMKAGAPCWWNGIRWAKDKVNLRPGQLITFVRCGNVRVEGVTVRNSPCWCLFFHGCHDVTVRDYTVRCGENDGNTDGVDVDCCQNVLLENLDIDTGDDAVAIRASGARLKLDRVPPCENVTVRNARLRSNSSVFRIGVGRGLIRNVSVENIRCDRGGTAIMMSTHWGADSGVDMENLTFRNCAFENVREGHMILVGKKNLSFGIRNVLFENVTYPKNARTVCRGNDVFRPENVKLPQ